MLDYSVVYPTTHSTIRFYVVSSFMLTASIVAVAPAATYTGDSSSKHVQLRIGNGGAGQSILIEGR